MLKGKKIRNCKECMHLDFNKEDGHYCIQTAHWIDRLIRPCKLFEKSEAYHSYHVKWFDSSGKRIKIKGKKE